MARVASRAARRAGRIPLNNPTANDTASADILIGAVDFRLHRVEPGAERGEDPAALRVVEARDQMDQG